MTKQEWIAQANTLADRLVILLRKLEAKEMIITPEGWNRSYEGVVPQ